MSRREVQVRCRMCGTRQSSPSTPAELERAAREAPPCSACGEETGLCLMTPGSPPEFVEDLAAVLRGEGALVELQALARACGHELDHIPARPSESWIAYKRDVFWWRLQEQGHEAVFARVIEGLGRCSEDAERDAWLDSLSAGSTVTGEAGRLSPLALRWRRVVFFIRHCPIEHAVTRGELPASELDRARALLGLHEAWRVGGAILALTLIAGLLA